MIVLSDVYSLATYNTVYPRLRQGVWGDCVALNNYFPILFYGQNNTLVNNLVKCKYLRKFLFHIFLLIMLCVYRSTWIPAWASWYSSKMGYDNCRRSKLADSIEPYSLRLDLVSIYVFYHLYNGLYSEELFEITSSNFIITSFVTDR